MLIDTHAHSSGISKCCRASIDEVFKDTNTVFENYAPEFVNNGRPSQGKPAMKDFVGWTGISPISILFEFVFGIKPDAENTKSRARQT